MVSPEIETDVPNRSPGPGTAAFRYACWLHVVPERVKTYAAPLSFATGVACGVTSVGPGGALSSRSDPTTIVPPEIATERPNCACQRVFDALRYACCDHVPSVLANTYAARSEERRVGEEGRDCG